MYYILRVSRWSTEPNVQNIEYSVFDYGLNADYENLRQVLEADNDFLNLPLKEIERKVFTYYCEGVFPHPRNVWVEVVTDEELRMQVRARWQKDLLEYCPEGWRDGIDCLRVVVGLH